MTREFNLAVLKVVVAQICQNIGWNSVQQSSVNILVDLLHRYLQEVSKCTHSYMNEAGRTEANVEDVTLAFNDMSISERELLDFLQSVDSAAFPTRLPAIPVYHEPMLCFPKKQDPSRPEWIDDHLPNLRPDSEIEADLQLEQPDVEDSQSQTVPELSSPNDYGENSNGKREHDSLKITINNKKCKVLAEEGTPMREVTSVLMTPSGFLSAIREGKLPDPVQPSKLLMDPISDLDSSDDDLKDDKDKKKDRKRKKGNGSAQNVSEGFEDGFKCNKRVAFDQSVSARDNNKTNVCTSGIGLPNLNSIYSHKKSTNNVVPPRYPPGNYPWHRIPIRRRPPIIRRASNLARATKTTDQPVKPLNPSLTLKCKIMADNRIVLCSTPKATSTVETETGETSAKRHEPTDASEHLSKAEKPGDNYLAYLESQRKRHPELEITVVKDSANGNCATRSPEKPLVAILPCGVTTRPLASDLNNNSLLSVISEDSGFGGSFEANSSTRYSTGFTFRSTQNSTFTDDPRNGKNTSESKADKFFDGKNSTPSLVTSIKLDKDGTGKAAKVDKVKEKKADKKLDKKTEKIKKKLKIKEKPLKKIKIKDKLKVKKRKGPGRSPKRANAAKAAAAKLFEADVKLKVPPTTVAAKRETVVVDDDEPMDVSEPRRMSDMIYSDDESQDSAKLSLDKKNNNNRSPAKQDKNTGIDDAIDSVIAKARETQRGKSNDTASATVSSSKASAAANRNGKLQLDDFYDFSDDDSGREKANTEDEQITESARPKTPDLGPDISMDASPVGSPVPEIPVASGSTKASPLVELCKQMPVNEDSSSFLTPSVTITPIPATPTTPSLPSMPVTPTITVKTLAERKGMPPLDLTEKANKKKDKKEKKQKNKDKVKDKDKTKAKKKKEVPKLTLKLSSAISLNYQEPLFAPTPLVPVSSQQAPSAGKASILKALASEMDSDSDGERPLDPPAPPPPVPTIPVATPALKKMIGSPPPAPKTPKVKEVKNRSTPRNLKTTKAAAKQMEPLSPLAKVLPELTITPIPCPSEPKSKKEKKREKEKEKELEKVDKKAKKEKDKKKSLSVSTISSTPISISPTPAPAAPSVEVVAETVGTIYDTEGNKIWICPACAKPDDGSPMIGCDTCDDWYHWECVGISVPPSEEEDWFCARCIPKHRANKPGKPHKKHKK